MPQIQGLVLQSKKSQHGGSNAKLCILGSKEGSELMDRKFTTKASLKDGRKSYLAVAWEVQVLAITDTRGAREEPLSDGLWNVQPESLGPDWCENHVRELRTFFTVVLEPNIHTFSVLSETLQDFLKSKLC